MVVQDYAWSMLQFELCVVLRTAKRLLPFRL